VSTHLTLVRAVVKACDAGAFPGGGISVSGTDVSGAGLTLSGTMITNNTSLSDGGGVYISHSVSASIDGSTFLNNSASCGGGIFLAGATATLTQTMINGNRADLGGGGICVSRDGSPGPSILNVTDSTIASNTMRVAVAGCIMIFTTCISRIIRQPAHQEAGSIRRSKRQHHHLRQNITTRFRRAIAHFAPFTNGHFLP
jgi:hypothetical protein